MPWSTMGLSEIIRLIVLNWDGLTEGAMGIKAIPPPSIFGLKLSDTNYFYWIMLGIIVLMFFRYPTGL